MPKVVRVALAGLLVVAFFGCGGQEQAKPEKPEIEAKIKTLDEVMVASMAKMGHYSEVGQTVNELFGWVMKNEIKPMGPVFGIYLDNPEKVKPESTRYEVCVPVPEETKSDPESGIAVKPFGGMQVASAMYVGAYEKVGPTYEKLAKWAVAQGYQVVWPAIEFYFSDPQTTPAESLKSEVCLVVKKLVSKTE